MALLTGFLATPDARAQATAADIQFAGALEFSDDGTLFVGDNHGGAIFAFEIAAEPTRRSRGRRRGQQDLLLTVPTVVLAQVASLHGLARREAPLDLPDMGLSVFRNAAAANEPGVRWFVERVAASAHQLTE